MSHIKQITSAPISGDVPMQVTATYEDGTQETHDVQALRLVYKPPIQWHHIMDKQPENGNVIIQVDVPLYDMYEGSFPHHYLVGMRQWFIGCTWEEYMEYCKRENWFPNYWWTLAKDFPFPTNIRDKEKVARDLLNDSFTINLKEP